jgi:mono/diheme cytochrome c family protein
MLAVTRQPAQLNGVSLLTMLFIVLTLVGARGQPAGSPENDLDEQGKYVFRKANCMGCHKWDGSGGGGYGGDALSLRRTQLTRDQIIMTVECGRPGTGMPYHLRGAYDDPNKPCYGMDRQQAGEQMPPEPATYLRMDDIKAVVAYVIDHIKGKGETTYSDCTAFWGTGSRVCNIYRDAGHAQAQP